MGVGKPPWAPTCTFAPPPNNAAIEATADNFKALFRIVQSDLAAADPSRKTPTRSLRRRKSDPFYRKGTPDNRQYYNTGRGQWQSCLKHKEESPVGKTKTTRKRQKVAASPKRKGKKESRVPTAAQRESWDRRRIPPSARVALATYRRQRAQQVSTESYEAAAGDEARGSESFADSILDGDDSSCSKSFGHESDPDE